MRSLDKVIVVASGLTIIWALLCWTDGDVEPLPSTRTETLEKDSRDQLRSAVEKQMRREIADAVPGLAGANDEYEIHVVNEAGYSVPGAFLLHAPSLAAQVDPRGALIGTGDSEGMIRFKLEREMPSDDALYVYTEGFIPSILHALVPKQTIVLKSGYEWSVSCVTESGAPLKGIAVALSRLVDGQGPRRAAYAAAHNAEVPGPSPETCVYTAKSDVDGRATFRGLSQGTYCFKLAHDAYIPIGGVDSFYGHSVPGPCPTIILASPCAAVIRVSGNDRILAFNRPRPRREFESESRFPVLGGKPLLALRQLFPQDLVFVDMASSDLRRSGQPPHLRICLLFERAGWITKDIPMAQLSGGVLPTIVTPPEATVDATVEYRFVLSPPIALPPNTDPPTVTVLGEIGGHSIHIDAPLQYPFRLPPGEYEVHAYSPFVAKALDLPPRILVPESGGELRLPLHESLVLCRLEGVPPAGMSLPALDLTVRDRSGTELGWDWWVPEDGDTMPQLSALQWFPVGTLDVHASGGGLEWVGQVEVQPVQDGPLRLAIPLSLR